MFSDALEPVFGSVTALPTRSKFAAVFEREDVRLDISDAKDVPAYVQPTPTGEGDLAHGRHECDFFHDFFTSFLFSFSIIKVLLLL